MLDALPFDVDRTALRRLLPGDLAALLFLVAVGELRHGIEPWASPRRYLLVALPFLVGLLVVGTVAGAYSRRATESVGWSVGVTLVAWPVAAAVGLELRGTSLFPGTADPVFYLVVVAFGAVFLGAARLVSGLAVAGRDDPAL